VYIYIYICVCESCFSGPTRTSHTLLLRSPSSSPPPLRTLIERTFSDLFPGVQAALCVMRLKFQQKVPAQKSAVLVILALLCLGSASAAASTAANGVPQSVGERGTWDERRDMEDTRALRTLLADYESQVEEAASAIGELQLLKPVSRNAPPPLLLRHGRACTALALVVQARIFAFSMSALLN